MKRAITHILAVFSLLSAMSLASCEKDNARTARYLYAESWPESFGTGADTTITIGIKTTLPAEDILIKSDPWISAKVLRVDTEERKGTLEVHVEGNGLQVPRIGTVSISDAKGSNETCTYEVRQEYILRNRPGAVQFRDKAFKEAMLPVADADHDGDISIEEAEAVETIDINGKGVKDLTGLEAFSNAWKLDAGNNDIEDAMCVTNLHYLHWLNLKGNMNLKRFDVRGCTSYFEVCDFEVTEDLDYYLHYRYMGVTWPDDKECHHSHHSIDPRLTHDWSREGECYQVYKHTKGPGKLAIVFSGIGWIDVDVNDGTFERILHEGIEELKKQPTWAENWEYLDVYIMIHMAERRCQWMFWQEEIGPETPEKRAKRDAYNEHRKALWKQMEDAVDNKYCYKITIDSHTNMKTNVHIWAYLNHCCHIVPLDDFDNKNENYYNYHSIKETMKEMITIEYATEHYDPLESGTAWTDWKDFD